MHLCKVIAVGSPGTGKTKLLKKIAQKSFSADYKLTTGVDIYTKYFELREGESARLSIWDISEQHRFDFIRSVFFEKAEGALLVFDLYKEETLTDSIELYGEIKKKTGPIPFLLIGNNAQLLDSLFPKAMRDLASEFAKDENGNYIETSLERIDSFELGFTELTQRMVDLRKKKKPN